ncbi:5-methylcytosine restriction system specificity protein McrC [Bacillus sp. FJAT-45350]|uniref:5-methylcytosine restriction system specificity protein McrC n=1 Tax=Bacillus sp. FJAT-45350 TaxID=2011014 RepID=UPI000BB7DE4B|nr:hypothetical protein [Bacillus sp. FJAT-45350]
MATKGSNFVSVKDNCSIKEDILKKGIELDRIYIPTRGDVTNLGIHKYNDKLYSSNYVGVCRLKNIDGENLKKNGVEQILKVQPRFNLSVIEMLNFIRTDDEFDRYLAPQTVRRNQADKEIESLEMNELFYFYENESPIKVDADIAKESSILTTTLFLSMLKELCRKPLMGRMIKKEENLVGKVKGKILFNKHIRQNLVKGRNDRIYCKYLHYSEDIVENQFLKAALLKAKRFITQYFNENIESTNTNYNKTIAYCTKVLGHISSTKISGSECDNLKFNGCYANYKKVIKLAKMVLNEVSIDTNGKVSITNYIIPYAVSMEKLFEMYVRAYLKKNGFASYKTKDSEPLQLFKYDDKKSIFEGTEKGMADYIGGPIKPDIVVKNIKTDEVIVFDVKYKDFKNKRYAREDRLQLLAYALMYNCSHIGLIFPKQNDKEYLVPQRVQSLEKREIMYHELFVDIELDDNIEGVEELSYEKETSFAKYIENLFMDPKEI